jgi:hypothetical protein
MRLLFFLILALCSSAFPQPFFDSPMQNSVNYSNFYFSPNRFNPSGIGIFSNSGIGVFNNPLYNMNINPAYISDTTAFNIYIDYRTNILYDNYNIPYDFFSPNFIRNNRSNQPEPFFNIGIIVNPDNGEKSGFSFALTYQNTSSPGSDNYYYSTFPPELASRYFVVSPPPYNYREEAGHLISLYTAFRPAENATLGLKVNYSTEEGDNSNTFPVYTDNLTGSDYTFTKSFNQLEISPGLLLKLSPVTTAGISAGFIKGNLDYFDSYKFDAVAQPATWNNRTDYNFSVINKGSVYYGRVNADYTTRNNLLLRGFYTFGTGKIDLTNSFNNFSIQNYNNPPDTNFYNYFANNIKGGGGETNLTFHKAAASLKIEMGEKVNMYLGAHYNRIKESSAIREDISANFNMRSNFSYDTTIYRKVSNYDLTVENQSIDIPLYFEVKFNKAIEGLFGFNMNISEFKTLGTVIDNYDHYIKRSPTANTTQNNFTASSSASISRKNNGVSLLLGVGIMPADIIKINLALSTEPDGSIYNNHGFLFSLNIFP